MPSFDVVSEVDLQEVRNAVDQAGREIANRYDFKGTGSTIELEDHTISLHSSSEDRLAALRTVLEEKLVKRGVSLKAVDYGKVEEASGGDGPPDRHAHRRHLLREGPGAEQAHQGPRPEGHPVQTQGEQLRVTGKKRDDLQAVIADLKAGDFGIPLQFTNFRD